MPQSLISPFHVVVALAPLAFYLLLIGFYNLGRRPFVTTGGRDLLMLGIGLSGFIAAGPFELFMPMAAANQFGAYVWLLLVSLYGLSLLLAILLMRPRIVIYNCKLDQLRPLIAKCVAELDSESRWAGECLYLPQIGVQLHVHTHPVLRNIQLTAIGPLQNLEGWRNLYIALRQHVRGLRVRCNAWAPIFLLLAVALLLAAGGTMVTYPKEVAEGLRDTLQW
jgi:hypothetical protein